MTTLTRTAVDCTDKFEIDDIAGIKACLEEKGFAMVRQVIPDSLVEELKQSVWNAAKVDELKENGARTVLNYIEVEPTAVKLLQHRPYVELMEKLYDTTDLVLHRTACIARKPGAPTMRWHTDQSFAKDGELKGPNDVLNRSDAKAGFWFYLTGSRPSHGGLCVIEGSHRPDWQPPAGYKFAEGGHKQLVREDGSAIEPTNDEVPGCVRLIADGGDLLIFENLTFHAPLPNNEDTVRLSCGVGVRPRSMHIEAPWELPAVAKDFIANAPADVQRFLPGYTSIVPGWRPQNASGPAVSEY